MIRFSVEEKIITKEDFQFVPLGRGTHYKPIKLLWISRRSRFYNNSYLRFPLEGADILLTRGGNLLLVDGDARVWYFVVPCGYRGQTRERDRAGTFNSKDVAYFPMYESPRGSCGISRAVLYVERIGTLYAQEFVRTGRTYGEPSRLLVRIKDGKAEELPTTLEEFWELLRE